MLLDHISEVYHLLSSKYNDGLYWIIGGDKNDLKIEAILGLNQNFKQCVQDPTRLTPPAVLDVFVTDLHKYYQDPLCVSPLDVDQDKLGSKSDHLMVIMEPINAIRNRKDRKMRTFQFRSYSDAAFDRMEKELENINWSVVQSEDSCQDKLQFFHDKLYKIFDHCFPLKSRTVTNENQPFYTEKLAKLKRKKCREYDKHRKSKKYDELANIYNKEFIKAKTMYYRKINWDLQ